MPHPVRLSIIVNCYVEPANREGAARLLASYADLDPDLKRQVELILVDDHSPLRIDPPTARGLRGRLFRIDADIPWNQPGARNLGVVHARSDRILMHDMGQHAPAGTLRRLLAMRGPGRRIHKFHRVEEGTDRPSPPHANSLFLSRTRFLQWFGYDEQFAGHYAREDTTFTRLQRRFGARLKVMPTRYPLMQRPRDEDVDYARMKRDMTVNTDLMREKLALGREKDDACFSRRFLDFPFHEVWRTVDWQ